MRLGVRGKAFPWQHSSSWPEARRQESLIVNPSFQQRTVPGARLREDLTVGSA